MLRTAFVAVCALVIVLGVQATNAFAEEPPEPKSSPKTILHKVEAVLSASLPVSRQRQLRAPRSRSATPLLHELAAVFPRLHGRDRKNARALLGRPTDQESDPVGNGYTVKKSKVGHRCFRQPVAGQRSRQICVHWAKTGRDAPPGATGPGLPEQVVETIETLKTVWAREITEMGYRPPLRDKGRRLGQGPNRGLDMYLVDIGRTGLFGYCSPDPPRPNPEHEGNSQPLRTHTYCVLDNDYSGEQFRAPDVSGREALQSTLAHEFFHAVQSAYEFKHADRWLTEGTAVWMEGQVFPAIHSNQDYLVDSQLLQPEVPLDAFSDPEGEDFEYGAWIFWQFLSEYFGDEEVVREVIEAGAPRDGVDRTATEALAVAVAGRQPSLARCQIYCAASSLETVMAEFTVWNVLTLEPSSWRHVFGSLVSWEDLENRPEAYEQGSGYRQRLAPGTFPTDAEFALDEDDPSTGSHGVSVDRLSSRSIAFLAGGSASTMRVEVDLPPGSNEIPVTLLAVFNPSGEPREAPFGGAALELDENGDGEAFVSNYPVFVLLLARSATPSPESQPLRYEAELLP